MDAQTLTEERFTKSQARMVRDFGSDQTEGSLKIVKDYLKTASSWIAEDRVKGHRSNSSLSILIETLTPLDSDILALCSLQGCLSVIARNGDARSAFQRVGKMVQDELWATALGNHDPKLKSRLERMVTRKHGSLKYRRQAARSIAKKEGFSSPNWKPSDQLVCGAWLVDGLISSCPDVFEYVQDEAGQLIVTVTDRAIEIASEAIRKAIHGNPVFLPTLVAPEPWTAFRQGRSSFLRTWHKATIAQAKAAFKEGSMAQAVEAVNSAGQVAWAINPYILSVQKEAQARGIEVPGFPRKTDIARPQHPEAWDAMSDKQKKAWRIKAGKVAQANRGLKSERVLAIQDMAAADWLAEHERFYCQANCDWRGRLYYLSHFNPQREDRVRALFLFDKGEALGTEGLYWLKVHLANCGDFGKVSKRPFDERVGWVNQNIQAIVNAACDPLTESWWLSADKPWLFLAACRELMCALHSPKGPEAYVSRLPTAWDGSCSGLQHLCAMTRAGEGKLVNLTDGHAPSDVYQVVADVALHRIEEDAKGGNELAKLCLSYGVDRKLVKRNVMTYSYSSKKFGMAKQHVKDLMEPLSVEVMEGSIASHPFASSEDKYEEGEAASKYIASHAYDAITTVVRRPAEAMGFLQKIARALAHEGKAVQWTTPVGIPWANRYHEDTIKRVQLWLYDKAIRVTVNMADGNTPVIDKTRAANGIAPNLVHALDGAHLMMTVNRAKAEGIDDLLLVHDSFGCLASRASQLHRIIREEFVRLYTDHDPLKEVLEQAKHDLTNANWHRLPDVVEPGSLDINGVIHARYAFA